LEFGCINQDAYCQEIKCSDQPEAWRKQTAAFDRVCFPPGALMPTVSGVVSLLLHQMLRSLFIMIARYLNF
jgi:hypothetical protein